MQSPDRAHMTTGQIIGASRPGTPHLELLVEIAATPQTNLLLQNHGGSNEKHRVVESIKRKRETYEI
jgi:hypothetical protein